MYKRSNFFQNSCFHVKEKLLRNKKSFQNLNFIYNYVYILYVGAYLLVTLIYVVYFTYVHSYYLYMDSSLYFRIIIRFFFLQRPLRPLSTFVSPRERALCDVTSTTTWCALTAHHSLVRTWCALIAHHSLVRTDRSLSAHQSFSLHCTH